MLKTVAAFLNTEGGDLLIGVADDGAIVGTEADRLDNDDKFMRHLAQVIRNGLGDRASTCVDPKTQIVRGKTVCVVSCQRSPEPVFLTWKEMEADTSGDFYVRSGPGIVRLPPESAAKYIRTRFPGSPRAREDEQGHLWRGADSGLGSPAVLRRCAGACCFCYPASPLVVRSSRLDRPGQAPGGQAAEA